MPPVTITPKDGGALITRTSAEAPGLANYTVKRDWRRDLDQEIRREGHELFWPNKSIAIGNQATPNAGDTSEKLTLIHTVRRPNGKTAVIVGTPTKLWRFFALEDGAYFAGNNTADEYFYMSDTDDPGGVDPSGYPYFNDNPGEWLLIGSGFSASGRRWEAVDINGYCVLNNGVDLPVTYRVEDDQVYPIYELREQGIAAVGTIAEFKGMLICMDLLEITEDALAAILNPTDSGTVKVSQAGAVFSGLVTGRQASASQTVTASSAAFNGGLGFVSGMIGKTLRFANGFARVITAVANTTHCTLATPAPTTSNNDPVDGIPFWIVDEGVSSADYVAIADGAFFTSAMVGMRIFWDSGDVRTITAVTDSTHARVSSYLTAAASEFSVENPNAYARFADGSLIDRIQYRLTESMPDEPRRFSATVKGSITAGSYVLTLKYPAKSLEIGQDITITSAGINGASLQATILYISGVSVAINAVASTTVTDEDVQLSDSIGSVTGFTDLQSDSSAILKALALKDLLVVYKDTSIFFLQFTGDAIEPFTYSEVKNIAGQTLYFRNTLISVNGDYHLYAGRGTFYRLDLVTLEPRIFGPLDICSDVFFDQATQANDDLIFAAENLITKEIGFHFPSTGTDAALMFDYVTGTVSTSAVAITAAATIKKPIVGVSVGATQDWFVMGTSAGALLLYGRTLEPPVVSGATTVSQAANTVTASGSFFTQDHIGKSIYFNSMGAMVAITAYISATQVTVNGSSQTVSATTFKLLSEIYHRLGASYSSVITPGESHFGDQHNEKRAIEYVLLLSSRSPNATVALEILGGSNPAAGLSVIGTRSIPSPKIQNLVPMMFLKNYYQDRLTVTGVNNPVRIVGRIWNVSGVRSQSVVRGGNDGS